MLCVLSYIFNFGNNFRVFLLSVFLCTISRLFWKLRFVSFSKTSVATIDNNKDKRANAAFGIISMDYGVRRVVNFDRELSRIR